MKKQSIETAFSNGGCLGCCCLEMQFGLVGGYAGTTLLWPGASHLLAFKAISHPPRDLLAFFMFFLLLCLRGRNHPLH